MAELSQVEKINLAVKMVFGIQGTSNTDDAAGLRWFEERNAFAPFLLNKQLYMNEVPYAVNSAGADTNVTANPTILEKRDIKLSLINGTNNRAWAAYKTYNDPNSGVYDDWLLPQMFGQGYALRLFQDNNSQTAPGTEIMTTTGAWVPSYKLGYVLLGTGYTAVDLSWKQPLWARVYRYIGAKGITGATANVSLDDAYNFGHSIAIDDGPLSLTASNNYAPIQLTPVNYTPTANVAAGQLVNIDGVLYNRDGARNKWLSINRQSISFHANRGDANFLNFGEFSDNAAGYIVPRDCTLVAISANIGRGNTSKGFAIQRNGTEVNDFYFNLTAGKYIASTFDASIAGTPINIDFTAGDIIQVFCDSAGGYTSSARVNLDLAWRVGTS